MKTLILLLLQAAFISIASAQGGKEVQFTAKFRSSTHDTVLLEVRNLTSRTLYFYIVAGANSDTGFVLFLQDISSFRGPGFIYMAPVQPGKKVVRSISKKALLEFYSPPPKHFSKVQFLLHYANKRNLNAPYKEVEADPI